jgi:hypothetical protein
MCAWRAGSDPTRGARSRHTRFWSWGGLHFSHPCARHTLTGQGAHRTNSEVDGVLHDPSLSIVFRLAILAPRHGPDHTRAAVGRVPQVRVPNTGPTPLEQCRTVLFSTCAMASCCVARFSSGSAFMSHCTHAHRPVLLRWLRALRGAGRDARHMMFVTAVHDRRPQKGKPTC